MKKRIISLLIALSTVITLFVPSAVVHAELGIKNELQVSLMAALNIVPGYPSSYDAEAKVSAKDFVSFAYRLIGIDNMNISSFMKKYDLDEESDTIGASTAIKIILDIINYDEIMGNTDNYFNFASQMGLTKNVGVSLNSSEPLTYDQMVMLFWNTLDMKALKLDGINSYSYTDETVMEHYLKIYEGKGVVNANETAAIDGRGTTGIGVVRIDSEEYFVGNTITEHLIGSNVKFYYHDDNEKTLRWIETNKSKNQTVSVYGNDITSATDKAIIYDGDSKSKTLKLDDKYMIIYNGKVSDGSIGIEAVMSLNSQNYFIDNDSNGKYNVVIINDYEYYLVDAISKNTYTVNDYTAKTSVELGEADRLTVYENGIRTTADAIKQGSVIAVAKSADSSVISVQILDGLVTGEITSLSSGTMTISGTKYNISPSYAGDALKVGRGGSFYFDNYGRIVRCVGLKEASSQYGYLLNFYLGDDPNGDCFAEILTAEGTRETFTVKQSVNVNGEKCNLGTALQRIEKNQLVTYKVSSDKRITKINTANKSYIGRDTATEIFSMHFKGAGKYRKNNMCFNSKYLLDSTTPIFVIPYNEDKYDYTVMNPSLLVNNTTYDISVYDIDDYMYASCIVLKENFSEPENMRSKRSLIITDIYSGINDDDDEIIGLEGYQQGRKVTYQVKNKEMKDNRGKYYVRDLKAGDVVQVSVDVKGDVRAVQLLFKANEQKLAIAEGSDTPNKYWEGGTLVMPDLWVSFGTVTDRNTNVLLVDADGNDNIVSKDPHKFASATNVYIYENGNVYPSNKNEIFNDDLVYVQEYQGNLHEVMIIR